MGVATRLSTIVVLLVQVIGILAQNRVCNNAAALCSRTYDNVTYLGAHDSPYVRNATNGYSVAGDQVYTTLQQLDSGVRLLSAQVHQTGSNGNYQWRLCHTLCAFYDAGTLADWLKSIKGWLDRNPNEVVTLLIVNSDNANATTLGNIWQSANMSTISYQPPSTTQATNKWPTLNDMITQNKRLVNFIANLDPSTNTAAPYLLNEFTFVFENSYENIQPSDFSCDIDRPNNLRGQTQQALSSGYLPLMNHFRYDNQSGIEVPSVDNVNVTNAPSGGPGNLGASATNCSRVYGRAPTFILTDFSNVGPAITTIDRLNGVEGQTSGRLVLPDTYADSTASPSPTASQTASPGGGSTSTAAGGASVSMTTTRPSGSASSSASSSSSDSIRIHVESLFSMSRLSLLTCAISFVAGVMFLS